MPAESSGLLFLGLATSLGEGTGHEGGAGLEELSSLYKPSVTEKEAAFLRGGGAAFLVLRACAIGAGEASAR